MFIYEVKPTELGNGRAELLLDESVAVESPNRETLLQWLETMGDEATPDAEADINPNAPPLD